MKWDACIKSSFNGLIWGFSWYLDIVCPNWDAIIEGDYQKVMPLPFVTKYNQTKIIVPPFVKQLGVFSIDKINHSIVDSFISIIPEKFRKITLVLNDMNKTSIENYKITTIKNYQLDLIQPYQSLFASFSNETQMRLIKSHENNLMIKRTISTEDFISFYKSAEKRSGGKLTKAHEVVLAPLINTLTRFNLAEVHGIYNQSNELCGVSFFLIYLNRLSLMMIAVNDKGSSLFAEYSLVNEFIHLNSNKNVTLDFPQNAKEHWLDFTVGFGAIQTLTSHLSRNNLPFFYKLIE
jgi:hypothetical protein